MFFTVDRTVFTVESRTRSTKKTREKTGYRSQLRPRLPVAVCHRNHRLDVSLGFSKIRRDSHHDSHPGSALPIRVWTSPQWAILVVTHCDTNGNVRSCATCRMIRRHRAGGEDWSLIETDPTSAHCHLFWFAGFLFAEWPPRSHLLLVLIAVTHCDC